MMRLHWSPRPPDVRKVLGCGAFGVMLCRLDCQCESLGRRARAHRPAHWDVEPCTQPSFQTMESIDG